MKNSYFSINPIEKKVYMKNILTLPSRQVSFTNSESHANYASQANCGMIEKRNETIMPNLTEITLAKAVEGFNKMFGSNRLPAVIREVPTFHEEKSAPVELSESAKATFDRIGARARTAFAELQIERAEELNFPYKQYGEDYYGLMLAIDHYEYRLDCAKKLGINWDTSTYDLVGLEEAIENAETGASNEMRDLRFFFATARRMGA